MGWVSLTREERIARLTLERGKVNAINDEVVARLRSAFERVESDPEVDAVVLTGNGKFFSFGFDIPELMSWSPEDFTGYLTRFTDLYTFMFTFPKPIVAALNGHAIAGGCMLALACDRRIMVEGKAKISLNEITFGSSVFAGSVELLRFRVGDRYATEILYSGAKYSAEEAMALGMVDRVVTPDGLIDEATAMAREMGKMPARAFASIKSLLRSGVADEMRRGEADSIREFVDIWYSDSTWKRLKKIEIR